MAAPWGWDWEPPSAEPQRHNTDGVIYVIDWTRRRLLPAFDGAVNPRCLHGAYLVEYCVECSEDLDALARDMLP